MSRKVYDVVIIGAGLTGLTLAYLLRDSGRKVVVLESRNRVGGRIFTRKIKDQAPIEMGATWLGEKHETLVHLLKMLDLSTFDQLIGDTAIYEAISTSPPMLAQLPNNSEPSKRIVDGSSTLISTLVSYLNVDDIHLNVKVKNISFHRDGAKISGQKEDQVFEAKKVVSTLPPALLLNTIALNPPLPKRVRDVAIKTHTWMGESIKVAFTFKQPFWRSKTSSGTVVSNVGPISEMYDHSDASDSHYALKGFLNGAYWKLTKNERKEIALQQLRKYYGENIDNYISYEEMVWRKESDTFVEYDVAVLPHENNGDDVYQETFYSGMFFIGGSETARRYPGYMEGAVSSAQELYFRITGKK